MTEYAKLKTTVRNLQDVPVIVVQCMICPDHWYEEFFRRVVGYAFDNHVVRLKCNGSCGRYIEQCWVPSCDRTYGEPYEITLGGINILPDMYELDKRIIYTK